MSIQDVKDLVNIVFFLVVGAITVLTYRRVRITLLQPFKTEIFKLQLEEMAEVLRLLRGKGEVQLREIFHMQAVVVANTTQMFDRYAEIFFDLKPESSSRPHAQWTQGIMALDALVKRADEPYRPEPSKQGEDTVDPRVRAAKWSEYRCEMISLPDDTVAAMENLERILQSPLLPKELVERLSALLEAVRANITVLMSVLTECAKQMPAHYENEAKLARATTSWIANLYNDRVTALEPLATRVVDYIRDYYEPDRLRALIRSPKEIEVELVPPSR
ncbi:MAG: hypothetical protein ABMA15_20580 [Vicinamibacterales bacterium]